MASTNSANIAAKLSPQVTAGSYPFAQASAPWAPPTISLSSGTVNGSIDQTYQAQLTATTAGASLQLNGGGLLDPVGASFSPARLDALGLTNTGTNTVILSGPAFTFMYTATATFAMPLPPGGFFLHATGSSSAGLSIGTGTNSALTFTSLSGPSTVQVCAVGRSV